MSKLVYVCLRNPQRSAELRRGLGALGNRLLPDNFNPDPPKLSDSDGVLIAIYNPSSLVMLHDRSVCLGYLVGPGGQWYRPLSARPDGAYALFRADNRTVEVLADTLGSRTIWYLKNDEMFVASTSQRAIVSLLGSFSFNSEAIPWILASGSLGPVHSWDRRISHLEGGASLALDRSSWTLTATKGPSTCFVPTGVSDEQHERRIRAILEYVVGSSRLQLSQWAFTLSGGNDSRGVLCSLKDTVGLRAVTWGLRESLREKNNDAYVARELAKRFSLQHQYYETDLSDEPVDQIFHRFLICGEGRIDHVSGYMDGFRMWKSLYESGVRGIIRGDVVFGRKPVASEYDVRLAAGMSLWSDFSGLRPLEEFGLPEQRVPAALLQRREESIQTWQDRLHQQYRIPIVQGALSDLKLPYVESVSPLLSGSLVEAIRTLPDHLRRSKSLWHSIVRSLSPDIEVSKYEATESLTDILASTPVVDFLRGHLSTARADSVLPREFLRYVQDRIADSHPNSQTKYAKRLRRWASSYMPKWAKQAVKRKPPSMSLLDFNQLAFRVYIVLQMNELLNADAVAIPTSTMKIDRGRSVPESF
jgi:hypothetical protein